MPAPTLTFAGRDGRTTPLADGKSHAITAAMRGEIVVAGVPATSTVNLHDFTGTRPRPIASDWRAPYAIEYTVPARGRMLLGVEVREGDKQTSLARVWIEAADAPGNLPAGDQAGPVPASPAAETPVGCCCDYGVLEAVARKLLPLGVTRYRAFMPGMDAQGNYSTDHVDQVARLLALHPSITCYGLHGVKEARDGRPATPVGRDGRRRYWARHATVVGRFGRRYVTERNNEVNLKQYLDAGQAGNVVSDKIVAWCVDDARDCRDALGPDAEITDNSIGWGASADVHVAYKRAFAAAGMYRLVNRVVDHAYPDGGVAMLDDHFARVRAAVGPSIPIDVTEIGLHKKFELASVPARAADYVRVLKKHNAVPHWYRGHCSPKPREFDDRSLLDRDGTVNVPLCRALGLNVTPTTGAAK